MRKIGLFIITMLLVSCSQLGNMAVYSVSESQLEQMMSQRIPELTRQANVAGIPLKLAVDSMAVKIGPDNSDLVRINTAASATLSLFGLTYPANMQLQVEGSPYYDAEQKAVFVRSVKLLDSSIEAAGYRGNLTPVTNELLQIVNQFLATNPVYKLDTNDPTVKILTTLPINMTVQQRKIAFLPAGKSR